MRDDDGSLLSLSLEIFLVNGSLNLKLHRLLVVNIGHIDFPVLDDK